MYRLSFRTFIFFTLLTLVTVSVWFLKLNKKKASIGLSFNQNDSNVEQDYTPSSYDSLVLVVFLEGDADKNSFEKVRAVIGVSTHTSNTNFRAFNASGQRIMSAPYST